MASAAVAHRVALPAPVAGGWAAPGPGCRALARRRRRRLLPPRVCLPTQLPRSGLIQPIECSSPRSAGARAPAQQRMQAAARLPVRCQRRVRTLAVADTAAQKAAQKRWESQARVHLRNWNHRIFNPADQPALCSGPRHCCCWSHHAPPPTQLPPAPAAPAPGARRQGAERDGGGGGAAGEGRLGAAGCAAAHGDCPGAFRAGGPCCGAVGRRLGGGVCAAAAMPAFSQRLAHACPVPAAGADAADAVCVLLPPVLCRPSWWARWRCRCSLWTMTCRPPAC